MQTITSVFIGIGLGQCAILALLAVRDLPAILPRHLLHVLLLGVAAYLVMPIYPSTLLASLQTLVPGVLWLLCASLFDDRFRLTTWRVCLVASTVLLPQFGRLPGVAGSAGWSWLLLDVPQLLELVLLGMGLAVVGRHWRDDLVQARRRLRWVFSAMVGGYTFTLVVAREFLFDSADWFFAAQYGATGLVLLVACCLVLGMRAGVFPASAPPAPPAAAATTRVEAPRAAKPGVDAAVLERLEQLMTGERIYREMGLTIGGLASVLGVPQYRLRQAINSGLGYRNFNDFLNGYRVREAARRLVSERERALPILTIALDVGFRSLSAFNKAFKLAFEMTPTEYRNQRRSSARPAIDD